MAECVCTTKYACMLIYLFACDCVSAYIFIVLVVSMAKFFKYWQIYVRAKVHVNHKKGKVGQLGSNDEVGQLCSHDKWKSGD